MFQARVTLVVGALLALMSFVALLGNEGVFFNAQPERLPVTLIGSGCAAETEAPPSAPAVVEIDGDGFLALSADLAIEIDLAEFLAADCAVLRITSPQAHELEDNAVNFDFETPEDAPNTSVWRRNQIPADDGALANRVVIRFADAFSRVGPTVFAARLTYSEDAALRTLETFERSGVLRRGADGVDVSFQADAHRRYVGVVAIIFATLLGIGIGAIFEAMLIIATLRRISDLKGSPPE